MKRLFATLILLSAATAAFAQEFKTGYFLDNYTYSYRINPATAIEGDSYYFFSLGIGNITGEARTNLSMFDFLLPDPTDPGMYLFGLTDSNVSYQDAVKGFADVNKIIFGLNENILSFGHHGDESRWTVELNLRTDNRMKIPGDFFRGTKAALLSLSNDDSAAQHYDFKDLSLNSSTYGELAASYSSKIGDYVTLGGAVKALFGIASTRYSLSLTVDPRSDVPDKITAKGDGNFQLAFPVDLDLPEKQIGGQSYYDFDPIYDGTYSFANRWKGKKGLPGFGLAFDLGLTVEPTDNLYIEASILDLGFMNWKAQENSRFNVNGNVDKYTDVFAFEELSGKRYTHLLTWTAHLGAKYRMPFYDRLSVGFLGTMQPLFKEARLGIDVTPADWVSIAVSGAINDFGPDFGAALNLRFLPGINFFVGTDALVFKFKDGMPVGNLSTAVNGGLTIVF